MEKLMSRIGSAFVDKMQSNALTKVLSGVYGALNSVSFTSGGLAIHGAGSALVKTANTVIFSANGVLGSLAAADMPALSGSIPNGSTNIAVFEVDSTGMTHTTMGTAATTLAGVVWPKTPDANALIGFVIIANASGSAFTCGTTALDTGSVTTTYVNLNGSSSTPNAQIA